MQDTLNLTVKFLLQSSRRICKSSVHLFWWLSGEFIRFFFPHTISLSCVRAPPLFLFIYIYIWNIKPFKVLRCLNFQSITTANSKSNCIFAYVTTRVQFWISILKGHCCFWSLRMDTEPMTSKGHLQFTLQAWWSNHYNRLSVYLPKSSVTSKIRHKVNFQGEYMWFKFRVFLLDSLPSQKLNLSYWLIIAGERVVGFIPSQRVLVQCEMQTVSSWTWTRISKFNFNKRRYVNFGLVWFYGISTIVGHLRQVYVYTKQFYFKQFST